MTDLLIDLDGYSSTYTAAEQRLDAAYRWTAKLPLRLTMAGHHATTDAPVRVLRPLGVVVDRIMAEALIDHLAGLHFSTK